MIGRSPRCRRRASSRTSGRSRASTGARTASGSPRQTRAGGRDQVGCVVLGRGADEAQVDAWLRAGAGVPGYLGFASAARSGGPAQAVARRWRQDAAAEEIAAIYRRFVAAYRGVTGDRGKPRAPRARGRRTRARRRPIARRTGAPDRPRRPPGRPPARARATVSATALPCSVCSSIRPSAWMTGPAPASRAVESRPRPRSGAAPGTAWAPSSISIPPTLGEFVGVVEDVLD